MLHIVSAVLEDVWSSQCLLPGHYVEVTTWKKEIATMRSQDVGVRSVLRHQCGSRGDCGYPFRSMQLGEAARIGSRLLADIPSHGCWVDPMFQREG